MKTGGGDVGVGLKTGVGDVGADLKAGAGDVGADLKGDGLGLLKGEGAGDVGAEDGVAVAAPADFDVVDPLYPASNARDASARKFDPYACERILKDSRKCSVSRFCEHPMLATSMKVTLSVASS
jgi:hypothetical protein